MTNQELIEKLGHSIGSGNVLTDEKQTERFCRGFRSGSGEALAVLTPLSLVDYWKALKLCVEADKIVIMQAANTGLTEGSTPNGTYDRDCIIISTLAIDKIHPVKNAEQIVACAGATLFSLEKLLKPLNRQPHSVIGSSCIGASIVGGVCNNSGGALVERGPSYTELALYAQITADGRLELVNHLGINLGDTPEEILNRVERGEFAETDFEETNKKASDTDYVQRVRDVDEDTPARFNADKRRLYEASGCAGKLAVFAVRLDTYPLNDEEQVFYIGTNDPDVLTELRRHILANFENLPVSAEYMQREIFDIARDYGKDTLLAIHYMGTQFLPTLFAWKGKFDARIRKLPFLPDNLSDRIMQFGARIWPNILPKRMLQFRDHYEHHLILNMSNAGIDEASGFLEEFFTKHEGAYFACDKREAKLAMLHRFAAAGAAVRYQAIHSKEVEDILALDIALRRNDKDWLEKLPQELEDQIVHKLYYGHFMCHVLHQDYIVKKGVDVKGLKAAMLEILDERGAEYPAEHNVGHLYCAKQDLASFYKKLDPTNTMNPGIGKLPKSKHYA
ncbi:MAG: D-lactate dehydrogenase [Pseudomonadota bacterium]